MPPQGLPRPPENGPAKSARGRYRIRHCSVERTFLIKNFGRVATIIRFVRRGRKITRHGGGRPPGKSRAVISDRISDAQLYSLLAGARYTDIIAFNNPGRVTRGLFVFTPRQSVSKRPGTKNPDQRPRSSRPHGSCSIDDKPLSPKRYPSMFVLGKVKIETSHHPGRLPR